MEKCIQKGAAYGFLFALALAILFVKHKIVTPFDGGYTTEYVDVFDYAVSIMRYSVIGGLTGAFIGFLIDRKNKDDSMEME